MEKLMLSMRFVRGRGEEKTAEIVFVYVVYVYEYNVLVVYSHYDDICEKKASGSFLKTRNFLKKTYYVRKCIFLEQLQRYR